MAKFYSEEIQRFFKEVPLIHRKELYQFYKQYEPNLNESTFSWRIYNLKQKGIIREAQRGVYSLSLKNDFIPHLSEKLIKLSRIVSKDFDDLEHCLISTEWLNYFTRHQLGKFYYILEVEKDFVEDIFHAYSGIKNLRVLISPNEKVIDRYLEWDNTIIIKSLTSRSPKQKIVSGKSKVTIPALEKILVDVFCDEVIYFPVRSGEMDTIFEKAIQLYNLNFTKLLSYARRRSKEQELKQYLLSHFDYLVEGIF